MQGEPLYDFLQRQVKDQMRTAMGKPLTEIPDHILNQMVTKDVSQALKKYKMAGAQHQKSPSRRSKSRGAAGTTQEEASPSRCSTEMPG